MSESKIILITGCSSGIGYSAAVILKARGHHVIATARNNDDVTRLSNEGFTALQLDLAKKRGLTPYPRVELKNITQQG